MSSKLYLPICDNGGGAVKGNYVLCLMAAFTGMEGVEIARITDSHADRQCNKMANAFLRTDCERMLIIDTDILFRKADIENILSHDLPLVYGIYPKKQDDTPPCLGEFAEQPEVEGDLAQVRRCGRGFMLIRRDLLEAMKEDNGGPALRYHNHGRVEWDFFPSGVVSGEMSALSGVDEDGYPKREWISEDWMFCERARVLIGVPTLVDVRIALGHEGGKIYRFGPGQLQIGGDWRAVEGWFSEEDAKVYEAIAEALPDDGSGEVAEIGCWMGRSLAAFGTILRRMGKNCQIHAIDTFKGTANEGEIHAKVVRECGGSVRQVFERTMESFGMSPTIHEATSAAASVEIPVSSLDAVFIDGDHSYEAVAHDIIVWSCRVKGGGIIAGHDYGDPNVATAVSELFPNREIETFGNCWLVRL